MVLLQSLGIELIISNSLRVNGLKIWRWVNSGVLMMILFNIFQCLIKLL